MASMIRARPMPPKPIKRSWLSSYNGLNRASAKRKKENVKYLKLRKAFLAEHLFCQFTTCLCPSQDVHHKAGRLGSNYLDTSKFLAVCRYHHDWIENNRKSAERLGYVLRERRAA